MTSLAQRLVGRPCPRVLVDNLGHELFRENSSPKDNDDGQDDGRNDEDEMVVHEREAPPPIGDGPRERHGRGGRTDRPPHALGREAEAAELSSEPWRNRVGPCEDHSDLRLRRETVVVSTRTLSNGRRCSFKVRGRVTNLITSDDENCSSLGGGSIAAKSARYRLPSSPLPGR